LLGPRVVLSLRLKLLSDPAIDDVVIAFGLFGWKLTGPNGDRCAMLRAIRRASSRSQISLRFPPHYEWIVLIIRLK